MDKKANFLAMCLLDAVEDENVSFCEKLLAEYAVSANTLIMGRGIAPIHYACGMDNLEISERIAELMLKFGGDPNINSEDDMTPLHVAAFTGRAKIVQMLLEHGGDINAIDIDRKTPVLYAVQENHFDVIQVIQNFVYEMKLAEKKNALVLNANSPLQANRLMPNRINYNFDVTSPYYINITHRRHKSATRFTPINQQHKSQILQESESENHQKPHCIAEIEDEENLFELTEKNLEEYSKSMASNDSRMSLIHTWREKVQRSKQRSSILKTFNDIDSLLNGIMTEDTLNFTNTVFDVNARSEVETRKFLNDTSFSKLLDDLKKGSSPSEPSFRTAVDSFENNIAENANELNFIRSPKFDEYIIQMSEEYVHTDDENGLVFYEKRMLANPKCSLNKSQSSVSTNITVPIDYDTEALRAELTQFGEPPGPITKSTKRLYTKRLNKYKRDTEKMKSLQNCADEKNHPKFSMELERTIQKKEWFERIHEHMDLEKKMSSHFQSNGQQRFKFREGNLKTSFIYMLIDPRVSDNLPGESAYLPNHDVWKRFLKSIFYVGKGKSSRPYSHLYDAMKSFSRNRQVLNVDGQLQEVLTKNSRRLLESPRNQAIDSKKLLHILDIWASQKGVVCLHVFHNILPVEAYTREAAIIDALGLNHLTNLKRGDYYGPCQSWTMRTRKFLGIALLYKAMLIFIAEGESQLSPSDLI